MAIRDPEDFEINFVRAGVDRDDSLWLLASRIQVCPVSFSIGRGNQSFEVTVFVDQTTVAPNDYIKHAAHMLSLDFERLARQTAEWRLADDELAQPDPEAGETTAS